MRFSEFDTHEQVTEQPPVIFKVRVGARSALKAKHIIDRHQGWQLLACEGYDQHMVLTIAAADFHADWEI